MEDRISKFKDNHNHNQKMNEIDQKIKSVNDSLRKVCMILKIPFNIRETK